MPTRRYENLEPERKAAILDAAQAEFTLSGYEGASLNKIIADAGISKGSFYYYFEDKADLYVTALERVTQEIMERIGGIFKGEYSDDFWRDFEDMARKSFGIICDDPGVLSFARGIQHLSGHYVHHQALRQHINRMMDMYQDILRHGKEMGAVRTDAPLELLVNIIFAVDEGIDRWWIGRFEEFDEADVEWLIRFTIDIMKKIAGTDSQLPPREVE